jgi:uncharacterized protein (DUF427 family)
MRAIWKNVTLAQSEDTVVVEGNHYFPRDSLKAEYFRQSDLHSVCPWKGTASYLDIVIDGQENRNAGWYYPAPKDAAKEIKDRVAFWHGVEVTT